MTDKKRLLVFLSHASRDKAFVRRLNGNLKSRSFETWIDEQDIPPGGSIPSHVQDGILRADVMLVFLSQASVASRWLNNEWQANLFRQLSGENVAIVPLLLDDCQIPPFLRDRRYIDFRSKDDYETNFTTLLAYLELVRAERIPEKSIEEYTRFGTVSEMTQEILDDLDREQISFPMHKRMPIVETLKRLPRSGKLVRLENYRPKLRIRSVYDHILSLAHSADVLLPQINHGIHQSEIGDIALCIAYHELNEVVLGDIPTYTSLSVNKRNSARIFAEERLRTIIPVDRERTANNFIRMFLSDKHRNAFEAANRILSDPNSPTFIIFKSLDKMDPIIATWRYLHHYRGKLGNSPRHFNSAMKDFFENPDVKAFLRANRVDAKLVDFLLKLQDRRRAWDYYEDPSRVFDDDQMFEIAPGAARATIEGIPLFSKRASAPKGA